MGLQMMQGRRGKMHKPVRLALLDKDGPTGKFLNERRQLPW
jgi:hypothetical protein